MPRLGEAGVLIIYHEIIDVVEAQHLAQLRLKELELILSASADPTAVLTPDGRVQVANPEARRVGIPAEGSALSFATWMEHLRLARGDGSPYTPEDSIFARATRDEAVHDELQRRCGADGEKF